MAGDPPNKPKSFKEERRERLAAALRENLKKRKTQARARTAAQPAGESSDKTPAEDAKRRR